MKEKIAKVKQMVLENRELIIAATLGAVGAAITTAILLKKTQPTPQELISEVSRTPQGDFIIRFKNSEDALLIGTNEN